MKCNHCGECCSDSPSQINLTIGDVWRICNSLNISVDAFFSKYAGLVPFADFDLIHYDLDIGLHKPCNFRKGNVCTIYNARPVNCRIFPYWILAKAPVDKIPQLLKDHNCGYDIKKREIYGKYEKSVGNILLKESEYFEIKKRIDIGKIKGYDKIAKQHPKEMEKIKISLISKDTKLIVPIKEIKDKIKNNLSEIKKHTIELVKAEKIIE